MSLLFDFPNRPFLSSFLKTRWLDCLRMKTRLRRGRISFGNTLTRVKMVRNKQKWRQIWKWKSLVPTNTEKKDSPCAYRWFDFFSKNFPWMSGQYLFPFLPQSELLKVSLSRECWTMTRPYVWFSISLRSSSSVDWWPPIQSCHLNFTPQYACTFSAIPPRGSGAAALTTNSTEIHLRGFCINVCLHLKQFYQWVDQI